MNVIHRHGLAVTSTELQLKTIFLSAKLSLCGEIPSLFCFLNFLREITGQSQLLNAAAGDGQDSVSCSRTHQQVESVLKIQTDDAPNHHYKHMLSLAVLCAV